MNGINGIIIDGKVYVATEDNKQSCLKCDLIEEDGGCICGGFCLSMGYSNIFRYSRELTDKLHAE